MRSFSIIALTLATLACQKASVHDDATGAPIMNAGVAVYTDDDSPTYQRTDGAGTVWLHFPASDKGPVTVRVCRWAYAPKVFRFSSSAEVPRPLLVRMQPDPSDTGKREINRRCAAATADGDSTPISTHSGDRDQVSNDR